MVIVVSEELEAQARRTARIALRTPFTKRTWSELWFLLVGVVLAFIGIAFVLLTMAAGVVFAITFFGIALIGLSLRGARGLGGIQRNLARGILGEHIEDPEPFAPRPGYLGWLQSALRDRTGWRAVLYILVKVPLAVIGVFAAFSIWYDALTCLTYPFSGAAKPPVFGLVQRSSLRGTCPSPTPAGFTDSPSSAPGSCWSSSHPGPCGVWCTWTAP